MDSTDRKGFFERDFPGFPRNLSENCVDYALFILDPAIEPRDLLAKLESVRKSAVQLCHDLAGDHIWQRDTFLLQVKSEGGLAYLHGTTDYGDAIEDEWLVVYLIRELTLSFPNLWARVHDSDGEFLLIEAAGALPNWLNPEMDAGRAWLRQGKLHIIPLTASDETKRPLSVSEATVFLKSRPGELLHSPHIDSEAFYRLGKYPGQIRNTLHHACVTMPRKLAAILHQKPTSIAPAVEAFYLRVPTAMKPLLSIDSLHFPPIDLVTVSVRFTKVLFAQLKSQRFTPPVAWSPIFQEAEKTMEISEGKQKEYAMLEIGMKVTSAFEMLATTAGKQDRRLAREFAFLLEDVEEDGESSLPSDSTIRKWPDVDRHDDDSWLDIKFEDLEKELQGEHDAKSSSGGGFGDPSTQADLRKMVSRFESFLNDETAGPDGVELDDMDQDNDTPGEDDSEGEDDKIESEDEDKDIVFDEDQFSRMMREMMGLSRSDGQGDAHAPGEKPTQVRRGVPRPCTENSEDNQDEMDILQLASQMESELRGHGALRLDTDPRGKQRIAEMKNEGAPLDDAHMERHDDDESSDEEVDIDYNLARNLMESFKGQAGMAGPAGNMLGMMGIRLPRDEDGDAEEQQEYHER